MNFTRPVLGFLRAAKCIEAFFIHGESPLELEDLSLVASSIASASPKSLKAEIVWNYQHQKSGQKRNDLYIKRSVVDGRVNLARKKDVSPQTQPRNSENKTPPRREIITFLFAYLLIPVTLAHWYSPLNYWQFHWNRCQIKWKFHESIQNSKWLLNYLGSAILFSVWIFPFCTFYVLPSKPP